MKASSIIEARRELIYIMIAWIAFMVWVIGYAKLHAYPKDPSQIRLMVGLPEWVLWGVAVPWIAATGFTVWFALAVMRDLEPENEA